MNQKIAVFVLLVFQGMLAAIIVADAEALGLNKVIISWMSVFNVGVGIALNQLKALFSVGGEK